MDFDFPDLESQLRLDKKQAYDSFWNHLKGMIERRLNFLGDHYQGIFNKQPGCWVML